jgi:hypothetical protein
MIVKIDAIAAAGDLHDQRFMHALRVEKDLDPLSQVAYTRSNNIVNARVIGIGPSKNSATDFLLMDLVAAVFQRTPAYKKQKFPQSRCALQLRTCGDTLQ